MANAVSDREVCDAITERLHETAAPFRVVPVSWCDAQRAKNVNGTVSTFGPNMTDKYIVDPNGHTIYTMRTENLNERVGYAHAKDLAVVMPDPEADSRFIKPCTLKALLASTGLWSEELDASTRVQIRFEYSFVPISHGDERTIQARIYSYQTTRDDHPQNWVFHATPQAVGSQPCGVGMTPLYLHRPNGDAISTHDIVLTASEHEVGHGGVDTAAQAEAAVAAGRATSVHFGTRAMGKCANAQLIVQVPLKADKAADNHRWDWLDVSEDDKPVYRNLSAPNTVLRSLGGVRDSEPLPIGVAKAARVSLGPPISAYTGPSDPAALHLERDRAHPITCTVCLNAVVQNGLVSDKDIDAAVAEVQRLYAACESTTRLEDMQDLPLLSQHASNVLKKKSRVDPPVYSGKLILRQSDDFPS